MRDRIGRGHPGRECEAPPAAFERGQAGLECRSRGIARAGVLITLVLSHGFLRERRGLEDGDDDRTGGGLGVLPGVDGERFESGLT